MTTRRVARVLLDSPLPQLDRLFDYAIPEALASTVLPGVRVKVPLRSAGRMIEGFVVELSEDTEATKPLSDVEDVVSPIPVLTPELYQLVRRVADRAAGSAIDVLRLVIPKRMVRAEKAWLAAPPASTPVVDDADAAWARGILSAFADLATLLNEKSRVAIDAPPHPEPVNGESVGAWAHLLAAIAVNALARGESAVVAVPDHRDLAQLDLVLSAHLPPEAIVRDDATQSGPERYSAYLRMLADAPCVVIGKRSAVYAPAHNLGVVVVWDDGDPLLAEPLTPGVHSRDAALVRQELTASALVFAGHTRTTDVERLVALGWMHEVVAARRVTPKVVLSATREGESRTARVPSAAFAAAREALAHGPVLVQVAQPGYSPVLVCADCRQSARCKHCSGPLRAKRAGAIPECRWCGRGAPAWECANCGSVKLRMASAGSERTADELGRAFAGTRVIIADGDHTVLRVDARPALVVATRGAEPIAEGGYHAVILLDGDKMLMADELRIAESCLRWWANAAALSAPGAPVHLVGVTGPAARALATWRMADYARLELAERRPLQMPPTVRVAALEGPLASVETAIAELRETEPTLDPGAVLGPVTRDDGSARALVRFDYAQGRAVTGTLRASLVADALRVRKAARGRKQPVRPTLRVRVDVPDLDL